MPVVVADTSPIRYLAEIGHVAILPALFEQIFIPESVHRELSHVSTPLAGRALASDPPAWLQLLPDSVSCEPDFALLDVGEQAVLMLRLSLSADLVLMDDRRGVAAARARGWEAIGTLGLLIRAAQRGFIELAPAVERLMRTNFRRRPELIDELLRRYA